MPIDDLASAAQSIATFLKTLTTLGGLRLKYRITAGAGAEDPDGLESREIYVEMAGPDASLLTERGGELLRALEHVAAKIVRLELQEHDKISFDANNFKALRARERRMLHLVFRQFEDLETESSGEGLQRYVVVYPRGAERVSAPRPMRHAHQSR